MSSNFNEWPSECKMKKSIITKYLEKISISFADITNIPLFIELPNKEISSISKSVYTLDSLRCRLIDLCTIFDRINKKQIDKYIELKGIQGSKTSLIYVLKKLNSKQHDEINQLEKKLDILYLLRDFYTHGKNKNIKDAYDFLKIKESEQNHYHYIWKKVESLFTEILTDLTNLLNYDVKELKQEQLQEKSISDLGDMFCRSNSYLLNEKKKYITLLLNEDSILDTQLAETFGIEIDILRKEMLDLFPEIIEITYVDLKSTKISINSELKQIIINYYQELENEE